MEKSLKAALVELKECLDIQAITQEDFDKAKAELLRNFVSRPILSPIQFAEAEDEPQAQPTTPLHSSTVVQGRSRNRRPLERTEKEEEVEMEGDANVVDFSAFLDEEVSTSAAIMVSPSKPQVNAEAKTEETLNCSLTEQHERSSGGVVDVTTAAEGTAQHPNEEESFSITDATVEQFWSLILQTPIPAGPYYPRPEEAREQMRAPFLLAKAFVESLTLKPDGDGLKPGSSLALRAFHTDIFGLKIPWCISKVVRTKSEKLYSKAEDLRLDFYCPWQGCAVKKRWFLVDCSKINLVCDRKPRYQKQENMLKHILLKQFRSQHSSFPSSSYCVVELIYNDECHHHIKGSKGGARVHVAESLKELAEVKKYLRERTSGKSGSLLALLARTCAPLRQMAQQILNQPVEAFLGGFTDTVPHSLACYQKDNQKLKQAFLEQYNVNSKQLGNLSSTLSQLLNTFWERDAANRKKVEAVLPFNAKKCVLGYIQQLQFAKEDWTAICFREAQLLCLITDLQIEPALIWDGTEPNAQKQYNCMMFTLLSRGGYGKVTKGGADATSAPFKVAARIFTSVRTAEAQIEFFQLLINKSSCYLSTPLSLEGVVLVTDMDPIIDQVVKHFKMKSFWDHRHVGEAIRKKVEGLQCRDIVIQSVQHIRECLTEEDARSKMADLKKLLTMKGVAKTGSTSKIENPFFAPTIWDYLERHIFSDLNRLCKWTIQHLSDAWKWSQAVEGRNRKDLHLWNDGATRLTVEEIIIRYAEIDSSELRLAYLHFVEAEYTSLTNSLRLKRKNAKTKFQLALLRDYLELFPKPEAANDEVVQSQQASGGEEDTESNGDVPTENTDTGKPLTIVERERQLQAVFNKAKQVALESGAKQPVTKFSKPSKIVKRQRTEMKHSQKADTLAEVILKGEIGTNVPTEIKNGKEVVADYYSWKEPYLMGFNKSVLDKFAAKYDVAKAASLSKRELVARLMQRKEELLALFHKADGSQTLSNVSSWTSVFLENHTVAELKKVCKQHKLTAAGLKQDLVDRLLAFHDQVKQTTEKPKKRKRGSKKGGRKSAKKKERKHSPTRTQSVEEEEEEEEQIPSGCNDTDEDVTPAVSESEWNEPMPTEHAAAEVLPASLAPILRPTESEDVEAEPTPPHAPLVPSRNRSESRPVGSVVTQSIESGDEQRHPQEPNANLEIRWTNSVIDAANLVIEPAKKEIESGKAVAPLTKVSAASLVISERNEAKPNEASLAVLGHQPAAPSSSKLNVAALAQKTLGSLTTSKQQETVHRLAASLVLDECLQRDLEQAQKDQEWLLSDNFMNGMFSIFQFEQPAYHFWSSFAAVSARGLQKAIAETIKDVFIPFHTHAHWVLLHYSVEDKIWYCFDSLDDQTGIRFRVVAQSIADKLPNSTVLGYHFPHQGMDHSCGVYTLAFAYLRAYLPKSFHNLLATLPLRASRASLREALLQDMSSLAQNRRQNKFGEVLMEIVSRDKRISPPLEPTVHCWPMQEPASKLNAPKQKAIKQSAAKPAAKPKAPKATQDQTSVPATPATRQQPKRKVKKGQALCSPYTH